MHPSDIFKGNNSEKMFNLTNKNKHKNTTNNYSLKDKKYNESLIQDDVIEEIEEIEKIEVKRKPVFGGPPIIGELTRKNNDQNSYFMACCIKGGLTSDNQILIAHEWALENNFIINDNDGNISCNDFAQKVSQQFQTTYHSDWKLKGPSIKGHYLIIDSKTRKIIFDSAGFRNIDV